MTSQHPDLSYSIYKVRRRSLKSGIHADRQILSRRRTRPILRGCHLCLPRSSFVLVRFRGKSSWFRRRPIAVHAWSHPVSIAAAKVRLVTSTCWCRCPLGRRVASRHPHLIDLRLAMEKAASMVRSAPSNGPTCSVSRRKHFTWAIWDTCTGKYPGYARWWAIVVRRTLSQ